MIPKSPSYLLVICALTLALSHRSALVGTQGSPCNTNATYPCFCDDKCRDFKDCCPSAMPDGLTQWPVPDSKEFRPTCRRTDSIRLSVRQLFNCYSTYAHVFDKCPPDFKDDYVRRQCEEFNLNQSLAYEAPVSSKDGRLFRNAFCAICNSYPDHDPPQLEYFRSALEIRRMKMTKEQVVRSIKLEHTVVLFGVPINAVRPCFPEVSRCEVAADAGQSTACERGPTNRLACGKQVFRNKACVQCSFNTTLGACSGAPKRTCLSKNKPTFSHEDFSSLFDLLGLLDVPNRTDTSPGNNSTISTGPTIIVLTSISIASLLVLIVVYVALKPFRNFAGLMTLTVASCLLLAYLVFLISIHVPKGSVACRVMGHLLHISFLASFAWMAVMAFDLLRCFRSTGVMSDSHPFRRYAKYCAFGWGLPLSVLLCCVALDVGAPWTVVSPKFGRPNCYFNKGYALLAWMYIPVALILISNCVIMGVLCRFFHKTARDTRRVRENVKRGMFFLCIKITLVLGIVWIFQIIGVFIGSDTLNFVISILTSLQGLCISLAFMLTKQTKKNVQSSLSRSHTSTSGQTNTTRVHQNATTRT